MKYLTINDIKQHLRLDFDCEDAVLDLYGTGAEDTVLNLLGRTYEDVLQEYGEVPAPVRHATLLLVGESYQHREPSSPQSLSHVPYGFDVMIKPYMRLADSDGSLCYETATLGSQIKIAFSAELPDGLLMKDVDFTVTVQNFSRKNVEMQAAKQDCVLLSDNEYAVLVDTDALGIGALRLKVTFLIPDTDYYPVGVRRQVVNINPRIIIKG